MIDLHTHILPGIDDGSKNMEMTKEMFLMEKEAGVDTIVATPHFYAHKDHISEFLERRNQAYELVVNSEWFNALNIRLVRAAEVFYFRGIGQADIKDLCIEGTNVLLLEMPFAQWSGEVVHDVKDLLGRGFTVVLVHVERFVQFQKKKSYFDEIMEMDVIKQLNAEAFENWGSRRFAVKLMNEYTVLLGTDCHNLDKRKPNMNVAIDFVRKKFGRDELESIDAFARKVIQGRV